MNSVGRVWFGVARANVAAAWRIRGVFAVIRGQAVSSFLYRELARMERG